jgi:hypothetical protein
MLPRCRPLAIPRAVGGMCFRMRIDEPFEAYTVQPLMDQSRLRSGPVLYRRGVAGDIHDCAADDHSTNGESNEFMSP